MRVDAEAECAQDETGQGEDEPEGGEAAAGDERVVQLAGLGAEGAEQGVAVVDEVGLEQECGEGVGQAGERVGPEVAGKGGRGGAGG